MSDMALVARDGNIDIDIQESNIRTDSSIITSILLSLGIDSSPVGTPGWWGAVNDDTLLGNRLIHLQNNTQSSRAQGIAYIREALQWIIDDGVADNVIVSVLDFSSNRVDYTIEIVEGSNANAFTIYWDFTRQQIGTYGN